MVARPVPARRPNVDRDFGRAIRVCLGGLNRHGRACCSCRHRHHDAPARACAIASRLVRRRHVGLAAMRPGFILGARPAGCIVLPSLRRGPRHVPEQIAAPEAAAPLRTDQHSSLSRAAWSPTKSELLPARTVGVARRVDGRVAGTASLVMPCLRPENARLRHPCAGGVSTAIVETAATLPKASISSRFVDAEKPALTSLHRRMGERIV